MDQSNLKKLLYPFEIYLEYDEIHYKRSPIMDLTSGEITDDCYLDYSDEEGITTVSIKIMRIVSEQDEAVSIGTIKGYLITKYKLNKVLYGNHSDVNYTPHSGDKLDMLWSICREDVNNHNILSSLKMDTLFWISDINFTYEGYELDHIQDIVKTSIKLMPYYLVRAFNTSPSYIIYIPSIKSSVYHKSTYNHFEQQEAEAINTAFISQDFVEYTNKIGVSGGEYCINIQELDGDNETILRAIQCRDNKYKKENSIDPKTLEDLKQTLQKKEKNK